MGSWGVKVLESDAALNALDDLLFDLLSGKDDALKNNISKLLNDNKDECIMLGVAIVDASINGVDHRLLSDTANAWGDYPEIGEKFFTVIQENPLTEYRATAISDLSNLISQRAYNWNSDVKQERMALYYTYLDRLDS